MATTVVGAEGASPPGTISNLKEQSGWADKGDKHTSRNSGSAIRTVLAVCQAQFSANHQVATHVTPHNHPMKKVLLLSIIYR